MTTNEATRRLVAVALVGLTTGLAAGCSGPARPDRATQRYNVQRTGDTLVRIDTATGALWTTPVSGDGGWQAIGSAPDPAGLESTPSRYALRIVKMRKTGRSVFEQAREVIFLADTRAGRTWLAEIGADTRWSPVAEPDAAKSPPAVAENGGTPPE